MQSENEQSGGRIHRQRKALGEEEMVLMTEVINITSFEKNKEALIRSKAKVIFFQEHKVKKMEVGRIKKEMKDR